MDQRARVQASNQFTLLDTTLRDGSYAINFQFTANDTALIAAALEKAGFEFIEIGHGVGLRASSAGAGVAAETDEAYCRAAARALKWAKFGMFCIPGIAQLEDIDMATDQGMGFIRIGTDVSRMEESEPFICRAKRHGMFVSANFMKAYVMEPRDVAKRAALTQRYGSDLLCIADSAGGMMAKNVEAYFQAVREASDIPLGFHGHDNLGLAVANTLKAIELGAAMVDVSLQGIGRGAGNAATELVVAALLKQGVELPINLLELMDAGEKYIKPLLTRSGLSSVDVISGVADFHSSYMGVIRKYAEQYQVDPRKLIVRLCVHDKLNAPPELVERLARQLSQEREAIFTARFRLDGYYGDEQDLERKVTTTDVPMKKAT